jgi:hypothetical protein
VFPSKRANASVRERTPNLAILATESGAEAGLGVLLGDPLGVSRRAARSIERQPLLAEAREILERLEAKPWLETTRPAIFCWAGDRARDCRLLTLRLRHSTGGVRPHHMAGGHGPANLVAPREGPQPGCGSPSTSRRSRGTELDGDLERPRARKAD